MKFYVGKWETRYNEHTMYSPDKHLVESRHNSKSCEIIEFETEIFWEGWWRGGEEDFYAVFVIHEGNLVCIEYEYKEEWENGEDVGFKHATFSRSETIKAR